MDIMSNDELRRKCISKSEYDEAENMFRDSEIYSMSMTKAARNSISFEAKVKEKGQNYSIVVELEKEEGRYQIRDYVCQCPQYRVYMKMCRHVAAFVKEIEFEMDDFELDELLENEIGSEVVVYDESREDDLFEKEGEKRNPQEHLKYLQQTLYQLMPEAFSQKPGNITKQTPAVKTSEGLMQVMQGIIQKDRSRFCMQETKGDVALELTLHLDGAKPEFDLRVGRKQKYVIKNIMRFVEAVRKQEYVKYGKNLGFCHTRGAFCQDVWDLLDFLDTCVPRTKTYTYYYGYTRRYELDEKELDELVPVMNKMSQLYVTTYFNDEKQPLVINYGNPSIAVSVMNKEDGRAATLRISDEIYLLYGVWKMYVYMDGVLYVCTDEYRENMESFLELVCMGHYGERFIESSTYGRKRILEIRKQDYGMFCTTILPVLKKYANVSFENIDFDEYLPKPVEFEVYLELDSQERVICRAQALYGDVKHNLWEIPSNEQSYRDIRTEYELRSLLGQYFTDRNEEERCFVMQEEERLASLVEEGVSQIENMADVYVSEDFKKIRIVHNLPVTAGVALKGNLLQVTWNVDNMSGQELADILQSYRRKQKYHRLKTGELLNLRQDELDVLAGMQDDLQISRTQLRSGKADIPLYRALYLEKLMNDNAKQITFTRNKEFGQMLETFEQIRETKVELPGQLQAQLRNYQSEGYQWACVLAKLGLGGILADDMGLGKTLQMIAYLAHAKGETHLVVCPASLVYNWESEFRRFAPTIKTGLMVGNGTQRRECMEHYLDYDVIITSYDLLKRDVDLYQDKQFGCEVIDEAQYIKNPSTQAAKAVRTINSRNRFALTGTPIENRLSELWSIFEYLIPGYLYSYKVFKEKFEENIIEGSEAEEQKALQRLLGMVQPFILRRMKQDVLDELPDKVEKVVYARFDNEQKKLYQAVEKNIIVNLKNKSEQQFKQNKLQILAELTKLRQICCDPSLLYENYSQGSAKLDVCLEYIQNAIEGGHRILLFSQFTSMLDIIEKELDKRNIRSFMLTGATSKLKRRELVERFQQNEAEVFLISLKAGGTGLNLTAADIVIHYDPWWNVAAQNQATDRAHRIGQENKVTVIRLIASDTIEERIVKLQEKKQELADKIINGEGMSLASFDRDELLELFTFDKD